MRKKKKKLHFFNQCWELGVLIRKLAKANITQLIILVSSAIVFASNMKRDLFLILKPHAPKNIFGQIIPLIHLLNWIEYHFVCTLAVVLPIRFVFVTHFLHVVLLLYTIWSMCFKTNCHPLSGFSKLFDPVGLRAVCNVKYLLISGNN